MRVLGKHAQTGFLLGWGTCPVLPADLPAGSTPPHKSTCTLRTPMSFADGCVSYMNCELLRQNSATRIGDTRDRVARAIRKAVGTGETSQEVLWGREERSSGQGWAVQVAGHRGLRKLKCEVPLTSSPNHSLNDSQAGLWEFYWGFFRAFNLLSLFFREVNEGAGGRARLEKLKYTVNPNQGGRGAYLSRAAMQVSQKRCPHSVCFGLHSTRRHFSHLYLSSTVFTNLSL